MEGSREAGDEPARASQREQLDWSKMDWARIKGLSGAPACSLGDVAARQCPAGHRKERSRARRQRAAGAWCPCPGARHVVPRGWLGRGGAASDGPRRCPRFTSDRGGSRGEPRARGAWCLSRSARGSASELYKPTSPTEFLDVMTWVWRGHRRPQGRFQVDVHICL